VERLEENEESSGEGYGQIVYKKKKATTTTTTTKKAASCSN
jgi:hypothetical protein